MQTMRSWRWVFVGLLLASATSLWAEFSCTVITEKNNRQELLRARFFANDGFGRNAVSGDVLRGTDRTGATKSVPISVLRKVELQNGAQGREVTATLYYPSGETELLGKAQPRFIYGYDAHGAKIEYRIADYTVLILEL